MLGPIRASIQKTGIRTGFDVLNLQRFPDDETEVSYNFILLFNQIVPDVWTLYAADGDFRNQVMERTLYCVRDLTFEALRPSP